MNAIVRPWPAGRVVSAEDRVRDLDDRLAESSALAVRVAFSVLRNHADAEDVAQEAFVRASRRLGALRDRDRFRAWLVRLTWRMAIDWQRSGRRRGTREDAVARLAPQHGNAEVDVAARERAARLWQAIDALPERLRLVLVLAAIDGHTTREVAALAGVAEGTVKSRLFEARRRLQEQLR
jgi:RNA polymerase sigma-70 factor (ECF subfamily)